MKTPSIPLVVLFIAAAGLAHGQTIERLYSFPENESSGANPSVSLTVGPDGALYGTAQRGGVGDNGTVFRITTAGQFTLLGNFTTATTGQYPATRLLNLGDGLLYGVTEGNGRINGQPEGTIFSVSPAGGVNVVRGLPLRPAALSYPVSILSTATGNFTVLTGSLNDGGLWHVSADSGVPITSTVFGANAGNHFKHPTLGNDGFLYAVAQGSNPIFPAPSPGTIIRVRPDGTGFSLLHNCVMATGVNPNGGMVQATDGNFYGTMSGGGSAGKGCVFRLTPAGVYSVIANFPATGMVNPIGDLTQASDGFLYGVTSSGYGDVFRVSLAGVLTKVRGFDFSNTGAYPLAGLTQAEDGNLYGTTTGGGPDRAGTIFRVKIPAPPPNRAPLALADVAFVLGDTPTEIKVLANDTDPENGKLTVAIVRAPQFGNAVVNASGTITYSPGGGFEDGDSFTYRITDPLGKSSIAGVGVFAGSPAPDPQPGVYNGLVYLDPTISSEGTVPRGQIVAKLTNTGKLTGKLSFQGKRVGFKATVVGGVAVARVALAGKPKAALILSFDRVHGRIFNAVVSGAENWTGNLLPVVFNLSTPTPPPVAYTLVLGILSPTTDQPAANGFGTAIHTRKTGVVKCVGKMPDGTPLSWATHLVDFPPPMNAGGFVPVYANPIKGGVCGGELILSEGGPMFWYRPPAQPGTPYDTGFTATLEPRFHSYTPVASLTDLATFDISSILTTGARSGAVSATFKVEPLKIVPTAPLRSFTVNKKTGAFSGKILIGGKVLPFGGVFFGGIGAAGHFILNGETDSLTFGL